MEGLGAGLSALAFWGFIAAICIAGIWYGLRERQAQYETLRRLIDSGKSIDEGIVKEVLGSKVRVERGLRIGGVITLFAAPGMAVFAFFIGKISEPGYVALLGLAALAAFVGAGLLVASRFAESSSRDTVADSVRRNMPR